MAEKAGSRAAIFWIQVFYLVLLAILVVRYVRDPSTFPTALGPIPTGVPWFGALGAVMISLWGVTFHRDDWDEKWKYWHWSRPFVGASLASVTFLVLKAGLISLGQAPAPPDGANNNYLYYVVAFVVGYREETFRDLLQKVADIILGPASVSTRPTIASLNPATGPKAGGTVVTITGSGFTGASGVKFGTEPALHTIKSDASIEATSPAAQAPGKVSVIVFAQGGATASAEFHYT